MSSSISADQQWRNVAKGLQTLPVHIVKCRNCGTVLHSVDRKIKYWCECKAVGIYGGMNNRKYLGERMLLAMPTLVDVEFALAADAGEADVVAPVQLAYDIFRDAVSRPDVPIQPIRFLFADLCIRQQWSEKDALHWYTRMVPYLRRGMRCESLHCDPGVRPARARAWAELVDDKCTSLLNQATKDDIGRFFLAVFELAWNMYRRGFYGALVSSSASSSSTSSSSASSLRDTHRMQWELNRIADAVKRSGIDVLETTQKEDGIFKLSLRFLASGVLMPTHASSLGADASFVLALETNVDAHPARVPTCHIDGLHGKMWILFPCRHGSYVCPGFLAKLWNPFMSMVDFGHSIARSISDWLEAEAKTKSTFSCLLGQNALVPIFEA